MIIGTAGHIDHGKTALVRALTGVETDRLKEEKARGISIDLGFAYLEAPDGRRLGFVDVPGHERFVQTMLAGAGGIDFALLVVAADDGPMPQTREHLAILDLLGIERGAVALTKADLVGSDRLGQVEAEIRSALAGTRLARCPILPVSARSGAGIDDLRDRLFAAARADSTRDARRRFRLAVDRSFIIQGAGTVVTGTVLSGQIAVGDAVTVSPSGLSARVRAIHAQNAAATRGLAGERCALNLVGEGIGRDAVRRGDMVCDPALHSPATRIDATCRLLPSETKSLQVWMPVRLAHASANVAARMVPLSDTQLAPGESGLVQLVLESPIAAVAGDRFVLRDITAQRTIGGGRFLDLRAPARKRRTSERLAQLAAAALSEPDMQLGAHLVVPPYHLAFSEWARDQALSATEAEALVERLRLVAVPCGEGVTVFAPEHWATLTEGLVERLGLFHADNPDLMGMGQEALRLTLEPRLGVPLFRAVLRALMRAGRLALQGAWVRLPTHVVQLAPLDERRWEAVHPRLGGTERFRPPRVRDLVEPSGLPEGEARRLLKLTSRLGWVDEISRDHFFLRDTVSEMVDIVADLSQTYAEAGFTAAQFRDRVDNGRKVAILILEFFDRHGVTLRRDDRRWANPHRLDLFRAAPT